MRDFRQLDVWHKSHALALETYRATSVFPTHELYGLTSQLRRSCVSIPANIAEGCGRGSSRDFGRFLTLALGSASETEYHFVLAADLAYLARDQYEHLDQRVKEVKRMLSGLLRRLRDDERSK